MAGLLTWEISLATRRCDLIRQVVFRCSDLVRHVALYVTKCLICEMKSYRILFHLGVGILFVIFYIIHIISGTELASYMLAFGMRLSFSRGGIHGAFHRPRGIYQQ